MLTDISSGLFDMHKIGYLHRDLKSGNVLLDENYNARLSDFDVSCKEEQATIDLALRGTHPVLAPEVIATKPNNACYSKKSDIYSFGILLLEVAVWNPEISNQALTILGNLFLINWSMRLSRLKALAHQYGPVDVAELIENCIEMNPDNRPTIEDVKTRLTSIGKIHNELSQIFLARNFGNDSDRIAGIVREYASESKALGR